MFKRTLGTLPALCLATSVASAQSAFIGEWTLDPLKSRLPDQMTVESKGADTYAFDFGGGPETIVTDGSDQPGADDTLLSVKAAGPDTWIVRRKKGGRLSIDATWKLSHHGRTLADHFRQFEPDGSTVRMSMDYVYQRVGEGSGFAGDWRSIKETVTSPFVLEVKPFQGDGFSFVSPFGTTDATLERDGRADGGPSVGQGPAKTVRRVDDRTLQVTIRHGATVAATEEVALSADLETLTMTVHVSGRDRPNVLVFERERNASPQ